MFRKQGRRINAVCGPWRMVVDDATGAVYYWNKQTKETTYDCPAEFFLAMDGAAGADAPVEPTDPLER